MIFFSIFLLGMMGFGHIFIYTVYHLDTYSCIALELGESIRNGFLQRSLDPDVLGEKIRGPLFFWRKLPQYIRRVCRFAMFFFWIQWGCKVKFWKKLRGRSFFGASQSILVKPPPLPGSTGSSEGLVGSTPNFFWACRFFFLKQQRRLHFGIFFST